MNATNVAAMSDAAINGLRTRDENVAVPER